MSCPNPKAKTEFRKVNKIIAHTDIEEGAALCLFSGTIGWLASLNLLHVFNYLFIYLFLSGNTAGERRCHISDFYLD